MLKNTRQDFGSIANAFHWLSAICIFSLFGVGFWMVELSYYEVGYQVVPNYHKSIGILLGLLLRCLLLIFSITTLHSPPYSNHKLWLYEDV